MLAKAEWFMGKRRLVLEMQMGDSEIISVHT